MLKVKLLINNFKDLVYDGNKTLHKGYIIHYLSGIIRDKPTRTSIQISRDLHIEDKLGQYINHSCDPSVVIIGQIVITTRDMNNGDSITFDYNENEYNMSNPFKCNCCNKWITGSK